jgi:hypothetical protein
MSAKSTTTLQGLALDGDGALGAMAASMYAERRVAEIDADFASRPLLVRWAVQTVHFLTGYVPRRYRA